MSSCARQASSSLRDASGAARTPPVASDPSGLMAASSALVEADQAACTNALSRMALLEAQHSHACLSFPFVHSLLGLWLSPRRRPFCVSI
eukprot:3973048-Pleurochrysis_carterae.AAC.5